MIVMTRAFHVVLSRIVPWLCLSVRTSLQGFWTECFVDTGSRCRLQAQDGQWRSSWGGVAGCAASTCTMKSTGAADTLALRAPLGLLVRLSCCHGWSSRLAGGFTWTVALTTTASWPFCSTVPTATPLAVTSFVVLTSVLLLPVVDQFRKVRGYPRVMRSWWASFMPLQVLVSPWMPMAYNMLYDFVLYDFAPIAVLLLLVVEVIREDRGNPLVMRSWWAFAVMLQVRASSCTSTPWAMFYDFELIAMLPRTVVAKLRKGWEYPLVLRSWWTTPMAFDYVMTELLGLPWRWVYSMLLGWCLDYLDFFDVVLDGFVFGTGWCPDYFDSFGFVLDGFDFGKGWCSEHLDFFDFVLGGFDFGKRSLWPKCSTSSLWLWFWGLTAT